jgi:DNA (cytosine-5)-methyltransferase 1
VEAVSARMWPTPNTVDAKGGTRSDPSSGQAQLCHQMPGPLNPTWVEWLMGFPLGWTACEPSATPSSRRSPKS